MDIDDFKHNTADGLHMACLGGVWMTAVNGFLGMRHYKDGVLFQPHIPAAWESYQLKFAYRNAVMEICVNHEKTVFALIQGNSVSFKVGETEVRLDTGNRTYEAMTSAI